MTSEPKTRPTGGSVDAFIAGIPDEAVRRDCGTLFRLLQRISRSEPRMWGESIVGFGEYELTYADGRVLPWPRLGFAPRRRELALYVIPGHDDRVDDLLSRLGKHRTGKSCLYVKRLADVDLGVLEQIAAAALEAHQ